MFPGIQGYEQWVIFAACFLQFISTMVSLLLTLYTSTPFQNDDLCEFVNENAKWLIFR
jgi:hypothetical protein